MTRLFSHVEALDSNPHVEVVVKVDQPGFVDLDFGDHTKTFSRVNLLPEQAKRLAVALSNAARVAQEGI